MDTDIAWAAGVLEGEGSFIPRNVYSIGVQCEMTDRDVLEKLVVIFGGTIYSCGNRQGTRLNSWRWLVTGATAADVMRRVQPWMMKRRSEKITALLERWGHRNDVQSELRGRILEAAAFYRTMEHPSLREAGEKFGVSRTAVLNIINAMPSPVDT